VKEKLGSGKVKSQIIWGEDLSKEEEKERERRNAYTYLEGGWKRRLVSAKAPGKAPFFKRKNQLTIP